MSRRRSIQREPSYQPIRLWLRIKRTLRNALIRGFKWSHLDSLYSIIHDYMSQTRAPSNEDFPSINPDQENSDPRWKKTETRFNVEPKPELIQAEEEIFGKPEPKPKFWQFRKKREAAKKAEQAKAGKPIATLIDSSPKPEPKPEPEPEPEPEPPVDADTDTLDYKLY